MPLEILPLVLALVVVLLFTLMAFMKLKSTEARNDEIRKLLLVAAEEARRVEAEHRDYGVAFDRLSLNQCAVCFSTTTSRCSRCKTVKYCSGKCQIIHWRQGHKQQCQPPDTVSSSGLVSCISSDCSEADSTISSEMQETRPFIPDLKEPKTCGSIYQRLNLYSSKIPEIYALETTDMLVMGPEITKEVSGPDISDGIESTQNNVLRSHMELEVPNSSIHLSSEISIHNVPTKTTYINDIPDYESTLSFVPTTFTVPLPDNVNYCTHSPIGVHSVCTESPGIHVPSKNLVNVIPCSLGTTRNICNSLKNDFPASSSFSSNFTEPITSEHELDYSSSFLPDISSTISQMSDFPKSISPKKSLNSKILVTDFSPAENLLEQSKSTKSHIPYASSPKTSMLDSPSDISCLDLPSSTSFASNVSSSGISGTSSPCLKYSNSLNSSSTIKFKSHEPNEPNATILASEIQGPRISFSNSTGKRTSGTDSLHCSPHRERVSVYPILGKRTIIIGESSVAGQVEACHPVVNGCSRSCDSTISTSGIAGPSSPCLDLVPFKLSSTSSLIISDACCSSSVSTIKFQNHEPNEHNATILAAEIQGPRVSLSNSTRKRTSGTDLTHSSPHRERVSIFSISGEQASSIEGESSVTMQLEGSHPTINGLKRSEQKSTKHPKFLKGSTGKSSGRINESLVKSSELFFPYEYFPKLFNWDNLEFPPRGLINCGNSCYANVVLQCLTYTRPLAAYLLHGFHSEECQRKDWCFMCELEHLVSKVRRGESALSPIRILSGIQKIGNHLGYGKQEDAHEFLRLAIDTMQSIFLDKAGGEKTVNRTAHSTTFIQQLFGGYLQSKVKCKKCQYESNRYELIMDLTVEVHGSIESLEDALDQFTGPELLDGENEYKCNRCKSYVKAQKRLTVHEAPNVLTIVLKRFRTGKFGKLNKIVAFPEVLDMSPYMSGIGDKPPLYKLYAVVVHLDVLNASFFGHYICYVKDLKGVWYKIDDSKVIPVGLDVVMSEGAYMLLYSRSSPRPLSVLHDEMAESCKEVHLNHSTYDVEQSSSSDGYNKETEAHTKHFPSLDICRDANVHVDQPVRLSDLDYHAMDLDSSVADSSNGCGFGCERISQITRDMKIDRVPREYGDSTSSDAGSLFSGSDETSCSTDSNRDSTSTVDLAETVFADSRYLECSNLNVAEACGISSPLSCMGSSPCLSETYSALENYASFPYHSFPNQPIGNTRIDQGFTLSNPDAFDTDGSHSLPADSPNSLFQKPWAHSVVSESSLKHRDMLDCSVSGRNAYLLQSSQFKISESLDHPKDNSCECFAVPAKRKHIEEKYKSDETEKSKLHAPSRTYAVTNFKHFLAHDSRTSAITKARSLGFER